MEDTRELSLLLNFGALSLGFMRRSCAERGSYVVAVDAPQGQSQVTYDPAGRVIKQSMRTTWNLTEKSVSYANLPSIVTTPQQVQVAAWLLNNGEIDEASHITHTLLQQKFDARGNVIQLTDATGRRMHRQYDAANRLTETGTGPDAAQGWRGQLQLDPQGQLQSVGLYMPSQTTVHRASYLWHDSQGRLAQRLRPDGSLERWAQDEASRFTSYTDADGGQHMRFMDANLQANIEQTPDGWVHASWGVPNAPIRVSQTTHLKDDFGRLVYEASPIYGVTTREYDDASRLTKLTRSDGSSQGFKYGPTGLLMQRQDQAADGNVQSWQWLYQGTQRQQIEPGQTQVWATDALGRVVRHEVRLGSDPSAQTSYVTQTVYDTQTGLVKARQLYDGQWLVVERRATDEGATPSQLTLRSSFANKLLAWMPNRVASWLAQWLTDKTLVKDIEITPFDGLVGFTAGNGTSLHRQFDIAGRLTRQSITGVADTRYAYGVGPRIASMKEAAQAEQKFDYAGWGFLKTAYQPAAQTQTTQSPPSPQPLLRMDGAGRVMADGRYQYRYSAQGQLTQVLTAKGEWVAKYAYDAQGQRIAKIVNTPGNPRTTHYLWEHGNLVAEVNEQGQITTQYFYLNEESQGQSKALPIAKWESDAAPGNDTGQARILMIHTDHRGSAMAMTNEAKEVVWRGQFNVWGQSTAEHAKNAAHQAELNLRLPGQYFDAETGLHDNRWRTYNPANGHYLQPDPMPTRVGYAQGYNPYLYVGGDPLNKIDPLGLYDVDTHYYTTFFLALVAGVRYEEAKVIALATQYIDDNPQTWPLDPDNMTGNLFDDVAIDRLKKYHFTQDGYDPVQQAYYPTPQERAQAIAAGYPDPGPVTYEDEAVYADRRIRNPSNPQLTRLMNAANKAPTRCAGLQFFGEYLHAFEDTFGHRNYKNVPIAVNAGLGHGAYLHEPDKTYNGWGIDEFWPWVNYNTREDRTLEMQKEVFQKLAQFSRGGALVSWENLKDIMVQWNKIEEDGNEAEAKRKKFNEYLAKLNILNNESKKVSVDLMLRESTKNGNEEVAPDGYRDSDGKKNRLAFLCGLKPAEYPSTILPNKQTGCK